MAAQEEIDRLLFLTPWRELVGTLASPAPTNRAINRLQWATQASPPIPTTTPAPTEQYCSIWQWKVFITRR
jgi:hypothetical protein